LPEPLRSWEPGDALTDETWSCVVRVGLLAMTLGRLAQQCACGSRSGGEGLACVR